MPTNLPPEAKVLERRYREARTLQEKIRALEAYISAIPEHKGTEKLLRHLKRRLADLRRELEEQKKRRVGGGVGFAIKKEGAAQVVILGMPNSGKSTLLAALTAAKPEIADYPCTTTMPVPGMMPYEDIQIQLVEAPALMEGASEGVAWGLQVLSLARNADGLIILLDGANSPLKQLAAIVKELDKAGITLKRPRFTVEVEKTTAGGIQVVCVGNLEGGREELKKKLMDYGYRNLLVKIWGDASVDEVIEHIVEKKVFKPAIIVVNKVDAADRLQVEKIKELCRGAVKFAAVSALRREGLDQLKRLIFESLDVVRVYTKEVGGERAERPLVLKKGSKVLDVAKIVHSQLYEQFKYAKIWGPSAKFPGEKVGGDHELMDGDTVEIHIK